MVTTARLRDEGRFYNDPGEVQRFRERIGIARVLKTQLNLEFHAYEERPAGFETDAAITDAKAATIHISAATSVLEMNEWFIVKTHGTERPSGRPVKVHGNRPLPG
jgi:hypothetical protein